MALDKDNILLGNNDLKFNKNRKNNSDQTATFGGWTFDVKEKSVYWSNGALSVFGFYDENNIATPEKFLAKIVHPDDLEIINKARQQCLSQEKPYECEYRIIRPDGEIRHISSHGEILYDDDGTPNFIRGTVHDITKLKETHEAKKILEKRLLETQRIARIGDVSIDYVTGKLTWSDETYNIFGLDKSTPLTYEKYIAFIHPDDVDDLREKVRRTKENNERYNPRYRIIRTDGEIRHLSAEAVPVFDKNNVAIRMDGVIYDITDKVNAELDTQKVTNQLLEAQRISHIGNWHHNLIDDTLYWSDEYYRICGLEPQECVPSRERFKQIIHPDDYQKRMKLFEDSLKKKENFLINYRIIRPNGEIRYVKVEGECLFKKDQPPHAIQGVLHDITDSILAKKAAEISENRMLKAQISAKISEEHMLDAHRIGSLGHWNWNMVNDDTYWSDQVYKIYGYDKDNTISSYNNFRKILHPDDADHLDRTFEIAVENHEEFYVEHRLILPSGENRVVVQQGEIIYNDNGDAISVNGIIQDITEIKKAQEAARSSETRLLEIFNIVPAAIITTDYEMKITIFNKTSEEIFGYNMNEIIGQHIEILIPEKFRPNHHNKIEKFNNSKERSKGMSQRTGIFGRRKSGQNFPASASVSVSGKGKKRVYTVMLIDATERMKIDQERAIILTQAQSANQAKSRFLATMSHELRTPLNAIIGFSEMMTNKIFGSLGSEKYEEYANDIVGSSRHLLNLVNDILDLSEIEAGKKKLNIKHISLKDSIEDCQYIVCKLADDKNIECNIEIPDDIPLIYADQRALKQIIINILTNAVKYTQKGGNIEFIATFEDDKHILKIIDNGAGIPQDRIADIINPFSRVENTPYTSGDGKGLGLAIVQSLMNLHLGSLKIDSIIDEGTVVSLTFPYKS